MDEVIKVQHSQEDGQDIVRIYAPAGYEYMIRRLKLEEGDDLLGCAVESLWSGYSKAYELRDLFGNVTLALNSTVPGAIDAFKAEYKEADEECDDL